jgi:hypothetical protein
MPKQWVVLENRFPASINRSTDWRRLVRGECVYQQNAAYETDGLLEYAALPQASVNYFQQELFNGGTPVPFLLYNRWWRIASTEKPYRLEYSDFVAQIGEEIEYIGYDDYNEDGTEAIHLVVPYGEGKIAVLKNRAGYILSGANGESAAFKKSFPDYAIGASNGTAVYSSAVINNNYIATVWDGNGEHDNRHYLWNPSGEIIELSRVVRDLAKDEEETIARVNWGQNLVIVGKCVYDLDKKRALYFDGDTRTASFTSMGYHDSLWRPSTVYELAFTVFGASGSFTATIETVSRSNTVVEHDSKAFELQSNDESGMRVVWTLQNPVTARVYRVKLTGLTGLAVAQIDALVNISDSPTGKYTEQ